MTYYIFLVLLIIFSIIGVSEICKHIILNLTSPKQSENILIITEISGHCEQAELILRNAAAKVKWLGKHAPKQIICIDNNMDSETRIICNLICEDYDFMRICKKEELLTII